MKAFKTILLIISISYCFISCKKTKSVNEYIVEYEAFQDTLSALTKGDWSMETDSIRALKKATYEHFVSDLGKIPINTLTEDEIINAELIILEMENELNDLTFESHLLPLNSEGGFLAGIVYSIQYASTNTKEEQDQYVAKLKSLSSYLKHNQQILQEGIKKGKTSPTVITQRCIDLVEPYISLPPDENIFLAPALGNDSLTLVLKTIMQDSIVPAYTNFSNFLKNEYLHASKTTVGIRSLKEGKAYYEGKIKYFTTLPMTPISVFDKGLSEVERIRKEMKEIIAELKYTGSFSDFVDFLRKDPQFYAKTPKELLYRATWLSKKIEGKLPKYFNALPRMPFTVEEVPAAIAPNYTGGRYSEGSYTTGKPGAYWVNTFKLESRPLYVLPALTLHEAVPGHHLQIMLSKELKDVPKFRQNLYISAFGEGWGLYSEYLGLEAGMYETPYENFGRLTYEMWRACRLVVDVGMHYNGWTRQQAVDFMASNTALSMHEVNTEIDRYIGWPAQAVSYKIGEIKIRELRKRAEDRLRESFDIKSFHDLVLSKGSIKLSTLESLVNNWIISSVSKTDAK